MSILQGQEKTICTRFQRRSAKATLVVVVEELEVNSMSKSAKGTKKSPGKHVKAKTGLNRGF